RKVIQERGEGGVGAFWVSRKYMINDRVIDCASTYPNRQMRFFSRNSNHGYIKKVHERIKLKEGISPEYLDGFMYLPTPENIMPVRRKWEYQAAVAAAQISPVTLWQFILSVLDNSKISLLWLFRLIRNGIFCRGTKMPLKFEMERHRFHW